MGDGTAGPLLRRATAADLPAIVALLAADPHGAAREDPSEPLDARYRAAFEAIAADPNATLLVAERDGAVVGTLHLTLLPGLSHRGGWRGLIESVHVAAPHRGGGIGARMVRWAVAECRARGCAVVGLTSNRSRTDAHRFYERLGFAGSHVGFKMRP